MKTRSLIFLMCFCIPLFAAIDPVYKECMQRGYKVAGDSCVFPDGSQCGLKDFNAQTCGQEFFNVDYCVEEGNYVWDADKCCEGLKSWLPAGVSGQTACRSKAYIRKQNFKKNLLLGSGVLGLALIIFYFGFRYSKREKTT